MPKNKRPAIPKTIQLKLWVLSGGRCEFRGCNEPLWRDSLTLKETNYSDIGHIIATSPDGPRGDKILSPKLAKDFSNLMLLCKKHHKLLDSKRLVKNYPVELLREYKKEHEDRIKRVTAIQSDMKTHLLFFKSNIGEQKVEIDHQQAYEAIYPRYPDEKEIVLDYTNLALPEGNNLYEFIANDITEQVKSQIFFGNYREKIKHISVFAIGPIPLLIYLGKMIGDIIPMDLYQKHRKDSQDWKWREGNDIQELLIKKPDYSSTLKDVVLAISLSGDIKNDEIIKVVDDSFPVYEIYITKTGLTFLNYRDYITMFRSKFLEMMNLIRTRHGSDSNIHLFPAIPAPISIEIGRSLLSKVDPKIVIYDYDKNNSCYYKTLTI